MVRKMPFTHPHALSFEMRTYTRADGTAWPVLEVATDLDLSEPWSDEVKSLRAAIDEYGCGPDCRVDRIDVIRVP